MRCSRYPTAQGRRIGFCLLCVVFLGLLYGAPLRAEDPLTNQDVIKLCEAGVPAAAVVAKIQASPSDFDTSVDALIALAEAGIPDEVIAAMSNPTGGANGQANAAAGVVSGDITVGQKATLQANARNTFDDPHCPGPGMFVETAGGEVRELDATAYMGAKTSGGLKSRLTYGILSVKSKAMIQGLESHNRVRDRSPVFYFCFEETQTGLSYETSGATTPSQFILVKLDQNDKHNARMLVTGKINAYTGGYSGPPTKYRVDFTYEKLAPGVYRVEPQALASGEYCFFYTGSAAASGASTYGLTNPSGGGKVFDFGI